jgi:polyhydroxybutyrate depolymerase
VLVLALVALPGFGFGRSVRPAAARSAQAAAPGPNDPFCVTGVGATRPISVDVEEEGTRTAVLRVPAGKQGRQVPLVIALHGLGHDGAFMERYSGFSKRADADGFAVVYPDARGKRWTLQPGKGPDDVAFIGRLLDRLLAGGCIDASRVYVAGVSNGGGLAALLGCEMSGRLAAIAAVAGGYGELPDCRPDHSLSVLEIHGTADQVVPYHAAQGDVLEWVGRWVARDRCARSPARATVTTRVTRFVWAWCRDGTIVEHFAVAGGQHAWPGADPPDPGPRVSLSASDEAWRFFAGRRRS